ncbi:MAG: M48 family metallopeptidase [Acidobacteriota bacterium]
MQSRCAVLAAAVLLFPASAPAQGRPLQAETGAGSDVAVHDTGAPEDAGERVEVPPVSEKAMRYYRSGNLLWLLNAAWGFLIPWIILFSGFSARLRSLAARIGKRWFFIIGVYLILYIGVTYVLDLPLSYYQGFIRAHAYDLSNQTMGKWLGDSLKGLGLSMAAAVLFGWIPYLLIKKTDRWWLYTGLGMVPFLFLLMLVQPIWIAPLFNRFGPMQDKALESDILDLAARAGIEGSRVYEVEKSVDTKAVNAYVSGFLGTKRIVLWDTIINKLNRNELMFVMGHEMGHYVLHHVLILIPFFSLLILLGLYLISRVAGGLIHRFRDRFGFVALADVASLPLILLLFNLFFLILSPVVQGVSRHVEHEADRFGLELTRDNHAAATAFVKLQKENLGNPRPGWLYKLWRSSHPPLGERIDFCNNYRPWENGAPLKYGHRFTRK